MARPTVVKFEAQKPTPNADILKELKELLEDAEAGKLQGFSYIANYPELEPVLAIAGMWQQETLVYAAHKLSILIDALEDDDE